MLGKQVNVFFCPVSMIAYLQEKNEFHLVVFLLKQIYTADKLNKRI